MSLVTSSALPSGSHTGSNTPSGREVTRRASPPARGSTQSCAPFCRVDTKASVFPSGAHRGWRSERSEEHTSELQSRLHLVCRLLLEKKKHRDDGLGGQRRRERERVLVADADVEDERGQV